MGEGRGFRPTVTERGSDKDHDMSSCPSRPPNLIQTNIVRVVLYYSDSISFGSTNRVMGRWTFVGPSKDAKLEEAGVVEADEDEGPGEDELRPLFSLGGPHQEVIEQRADTVG